jgi:hypothetical protein
VEDGGGGAQTPRRIAGGVVCSRVRELPKPWPTTGDRGWMVGSGGVGSAPPAGGRCRRATEPQQIPSAGTWIWPSTNGARTWPNPRRRQRVAGTRRQGQGSRPAGDAHRPRRGLAGHRAARPRAPSRRGNRIRVEEPKALDASPAITLALLLTDRSWTRWRRVPEMEKSRGPGDQVDQVSQALNRLRAILVDRGGFRDKNRPLAPR